MFLVPCSCGLTFAVADNYDRKGTAWSRYLPCPQCGKRHDPKNRLLQMGFHRKVTGRSTSADVSRLIVFPITFIFSAIHAVKRNS